MENIVVPRCLKMPGLVERAKTYRLEWTAQGLYLICLGNATLDARSGNTVADRIGKRIIHHMADKFEQQALETEARIEREGLESMARTKKSYFIPQSEISSFVYTVQANGNLRLNIKGAGVNMALIIHPSYQKQLDEVALIVYR